MRGGGDTSLVTSPPIMGKFYGISIGVISRVYTVNYTKLIK